MLEKITDRIYYMKHSEETDRPALGLIIGDESCMVIDAGTSPRHVKEFQKEIAELKVPPVKYLVLTHYHWDHTLGLCDWDVVTIAHQAAEVYINRYRDMTYDDKSLDLARDKGIYSNFAIDCIKAEIEDRKHFTVGKVDLFYTDNLKIYLGNVTCEIRHIDSPHTEDTSMIYIPEEKVMFLGDCIYGQTNNGFNYYDHNKLFRMIDTIEQYQADYYLCSHESICPRSEIVEFWQQLRNSYEVASKCTDLKGALSLYQKNHQIEPSQEIEFFLKSFGLR